jgi:hypothetical protein
MDEFTEMREMLMLLHNTFPGMSWHTFQSVSGPQIKVTLPTSQEIVDLFDQARQLFG